LKKHRPKANGAAKVRKSPARGRTAAVRRAVKPRTSLSMTERAYAEIRQRVITLKFRPGQFLNESMICSELGMGRTPVHEALHRLQIEGLVQIVPRKGILIRTASLDDVIALIETRMMIEPAGMALAAQRAETSHLKTLQTIIDKSRQALRENDRAGYMTLDLSFHSEIIRATGNSVLADIMRMLHQRASRLWHLQVWKDADLQVTQKEHEAIFEALKRGDSNAALDAGRAHLNSLKSRILQSVSERVADQRTASTFRLSM
jgi:DNA-binding GntR family transcriptional regulator